jgi:glycosyltransferase involved in cell wall biosynthesis
MKLSIVIPVHNEADHVVSFLNVFVGDLNEKQLVDECELLLVENGSSDESLTQCSMIAAQHPNLISVHHIDRPSYGEAIRVGMVRSRGEFVSILEVDYLSIDFTCRALDLLEADEADFIVASKQHSDSCDRRPFKRRMLTAGFNLILRAALGYPGTDTHGLKSIKTVLAKQLCEQAQTTDEVFQTEIVLLAWRQGMRIREVPASIEEKRSAPVSIIRRLPKVVTIIRQLRTSLKRFPKCARH